MSNTKRMVTAFVSWLVIVILLFGTVQLLAFLFNDDPDHCVGWVLLGVLAVHIAWPREGGGG